MKYKLIMENWRKFQKINENMEEIAQLADSEEFAPLGPERQQQLVSIAHQYAVATAAAADEVEAYKSLEKESLERKFVDGIIAINMKTFGSNTGRPHSFASSPAPQDEFEVV